VLGGDGPDEVASGGAGTDAPPEVGILGLPMVDPAAPRCLMGAVVVLAVTGALLVFGGAGLLLNLGEGHEALLSRVAENARKPMFR
jgi:hypothetical protein